MVGSRKPTGRKFGALRRAVFLLLIRSRYASSSGSMPLRLQSFVAFTSVIIIQLDDDGLNVLTPRRVKSELCLHVHHVLNAHAPVFCRYLLDFISQDGIYHGQLEVSVVRSNTNFDLGPYKLNGIKFAMVRWEPEYNASGPYSWVFDDVVQKALHYRCHQLKRLHLDHPIILGDVLTCEPLLYLFLLPGRHRQFLFLPAIVRCII